MTNVLIVNDEMVFGGVAKVLINMLEAINFDDVDIDILILHPHGEMLNKIPKKYRVLNSTSFFEVCDLSIKNVLKSKKLKLIIKKIYLFLLMKSGLINKKILKERKKIIKKQYDVEIAYKEGFCSLFVANGDSKRKINWIHSDYKKNNTSKNHMNLVKNALKKIDINIAQSEEAARSYEEVFDVKDIKVIRNIINYDEIIAKSKEGLDLEKTNTTFVSAGRLHYQKGFLRMMEVCKKLKEANKKFTYLLIGDGEEKEEIIEKINTYKLQDIVKMMGYQDNPYKYMRFGDLYVLPSYSESAPTVVYEALAIGTPVIACDVYGVKEQLEFGRLGIICNNNDEDLLNALNKILDREIDLSLYRERLKDYHNENTKTSLEEIYKLLHM